MERHHRALNKVQSKVLGLPNVRGVGVGFKRVGNICTGKPAIIVFVEKKLPKSDLGRGHRVPPKLRGLDTDVVEIGKVRLLGERTGKIRPAVPGSSIGHYKISAGTFGAVVRDRKSGEPLILSNNHILANSSNGTDGRAKPGDPVLQPGPYDGGTSADKIAELERFIPLHRGTQQADCPVAVGMAGVANRILKIIRPAYELRFYKHLNQYNMVDCAVARPVSPGLISDEIIEIGKVSGVGQIRESMKVMKSGRTSGVTAGNVSATGVTVKVDLSEEESGWFSDQVVADVLCKPGDSGSLVVDEENKVVGLLFAGSDTHCIINRIQNVMALLEIEF